MFVLGTNDRSALELGAKTSERQSPEELLLVMMYSEKNNKYERLTKFKQEGHTRAITDVAWAPLMGRSYHVIASASKDSHVNLWRFDLRCIGENEVESAIIASLTSISFDAIVRRFTRKA